MLLKRSFPNQLELKEFGYCGYTSVCMPRFYVVHGDSAWEHTLTLITINFLAFAFISTSCILVYIKSQKSARKLNRNKMKSLNKEPRMQQRIARIVITGFACCIPPVSLLILHLVKLNSVYCISDQFCILTSY